MTIVFSFMISVLLTILVLIFGHVDVFVWLLGFFSLGLESTLPLPQFIRLVTFLSSVVPYLSSPSNHKQRSLYGFRMSTLIGWVGGDSFKYDPTSIQAQLTNHSMKCLQDRLLFRKKITTTVQDLCSFPTLRGRW